MAITATRQGDRPYRVIGAQKQTITHVAFDSSYPTGGEAVANTDLGLTYVDDATCTFLSKGTNAGGTGTGQCDAAKYDKTNAKILVYDGDSEVADTTNLSDLVVRVEAFGY